MASSQRTSGSKSGVLGSLTSNPIAAALTVAATAFAAYKVLSKVGAGRASATPKADTGAAESWTNAQVLSWLQSSGLSQQCVEAFHANEVDGSILFQLEAYHLSDMGVKKLKDRILFQKCVDAIRPAHLQEAADQQSNDADDSSDNEAEEAKQHLPAAPKAKPVENHPRAAQQVPPAAVAVTDSDTTSAVTRGSQRDASALERSKILRAILGKLEEVYESCSSDSFLQADLATQLRTIRAARADVARIVQVVKEFPADEAEQVLAFTMSLSDMLANVEKSFEQQAASASAAATAAPSSKAPEPAAAERDASGAISAVKKLFDMLDGFLEALTSTEAQSLPSEDRHRLAVNIVSQVQRAMEVASSLPRELAEPLKEKCIAVTRAAKALISGQQAEAQPSRPAAVPQAGTAATVQSLIQRVRSIFDTLKSDKLLQVPPPQRAELIQELRNEMTQIELAAKALAPQEQQVMQQVFSNVGSVLVQLSQLTEQEAEMAVLRQGQQQQQGAIARRGGAPLMSPPSVEAGASAKQQQPAAARTVAPPAAESGNPVSRMSQQIREIVESLQSAEFGTSTPPEQFRHCNTCMMALRTISHELDSMPAPIQEALKPMVHKVSELVTTFYRHAQQTMKRDASSDAPSEPPSTASAAPTKPADKGARIGVIMAQVKSALDILKDPEFLKAPAKEQYTICRTIGPKLQLLSQEVGGLPAAQRDTILPMITKVVELVSAVQRKSFESLKASGVAAAQEELEEGGGGDDEADEDTKPAPGRQGVSEEFSTVVNRLKEVYDLINGEAFEKAPFHVKQQTANQLLQHVKNIAELASALPTHEKSSVDELILPLLQMLEHFTKTKETSASAAAAADAVKPKKQPVADTAGADSLELEIIDSLQQVFGVVNSEKFKKASKESQVDVAQKLLRHVESVLPKLEHLGSEAQSKILRFAEPLLKLLDTVASQPTQRQTRPAAKTAGAPAAAQQPEFAAGNGEAEEDDDEEESDPAAALILKVRSIQSIVASPNFSKTPRERRTQIATLLLRELQTISQEAGRLPRDVQAQLRPQISAVAKLLTAEAQPAVAEVEEEDTTVPQTNGNGERALEDDGDAEGEGEVQEEEEEENAAGEEEDRLVNFRRAVEGIRLMKSKVLSFDELQEQVSLLDEIDSMGISTREELQIRDVFQKTLEAAIAKVRAHHGLAAEDDDDEVEQPPAARESDSPKKTTKQQAAESPSKAAAGKQPPKRTASAATDTDTGVAQLMSAFSAIQNALRQAKLSSTSQLIPITTMIEEALEAADANHIPWRRNAAAVDLISETLTMVQGLQERLMATPSEPSEVEKVLRNALRQIHEKPPRTVQDLGDYIEVLEEIQGLHEQLTREDLIAYQELQKAVLSRHKELSDPASAMPKQRTQTSEVPSPKRGGAPAAQPNTPPTAAAARADPTSADQPPALVRDDEVDGDGEPREDEEQLEDDDEAGDDEEGLTEEQEVLARMLLQMIEKLQRQRFTTQELGAFSQVVGRLKTQQLHPQVRQILEVVEELIGVHRAQNELDAKKKAGSASLPSQQQQQPKESSPSAAHGDTKRATAAAAEAAAPPAGEQATADDVDEAGAGEEGIPDGFANELSLLPRILERLSQGDFVQNTTLFEIKCISKVLSHLTQSGDVRNNDSLREALERAKILFSKHMITYNGSVKDAASVLVPAQVTGQTVEVEEGQEVIQFTVFGSEEAEEYTVNEEFLKKFSDADAIAVQMPSDNTRESWKSESKAIIFCVQQYPGGQENATALSELMMLHDCLDRKHAFDTIAVVDDQLTAEEARNIIQDVASTTPKRVLVFYQTPVPPCVCPTQHAATFFDNSTLFHKDVVALCSAVEHLVIIHDSGKSLEVVSAQRGAMSPYLGVALTEGAAQVANTSRCWLFDGVFTPLVVELLGRDDETETPVAPEQLVTWAVGSLTTFAFKPTSVYTKSTPLTTAFWLTSEGIQ